MQKTFNISCMFLLVVILCSCQSVLKKISGVSEPEVVTKDEVTYYLQRQGINADNLYCMDTTLFLNLIKTPFKPGWPADFRPLQIRCYDKLGKPVMQWASCEGFLGPLGTFETMPPKNTGALNTTLTLGEDLQQYYDFDGRKNMVKRFTGDDYTLVVYFSLWSRGIQKQVRLFDHIRSYINAHPDKKIRLYLICCDPQPSWNNTIKFNTDVTVF